MMLNNIYNIMLNNTYMLEHYMYLHYMYYVSLWLCRVGVLRGRQATPGLSALQGIQVLRAAARHPGLQDPSVRPSLHDVFLCLPRCRVLNQLESQNEGVEAV